ncbi:MAG: ATP-binding protein [Bacteroidales bacterium]|nr:ATP-binding protein [Bacteroidales bacterium]
MQGCPAAYYNTQKLFLQIKLSQLEGTMIRSFGKLAKTRVLILDDFGPANLENQQ